MKLVRKLIVGISTIGLLLMTFISSTYAWFKINSRASVDNFKFEVVGGQGFLVSIDNVKYSNDLTKDQLYKAMLLCYGSGEYKISDDGEEKLYQVTYDQAGQEQLNELSQEQINTLVAAKIKLLPTTSSDGRYLTDLYNSQSHVSAGRFVEFNVYFKAQSKKAEDVTYEIYLNGEEGVTDDGAVVEPTSVTSARTDVTLSADMNAVIPNDNGKYITSLKRNNVSGQKDHIDVYSSNALRISISESSLKEFPVVDDQNQPVLDEEGNPKVDKRYEYTNAESTKIYELNDTINKNTDLGSYATNYTGGMSEADLDNMIVSAPGTLVENENLALYCSRFNAMYTYYNNLKPDAKITHIDYASKPTTIRDLSGKDIITTVSTGEDAKLLTFRVWLEGWDADCFDGLEKAVKVRLAFASKRRES